MTRGEGPDKRLEFIYYPNLLGKPRTLDMVNRPFQTEVSGIAAVSELSRGFFMVEVRRGEHLLDFAENQPRQE
jgi:hypothetical protein